MDQPDSSTTSVVPARDGAHGDRRTGVLLTLGAIVGLLASFELTLDKIRLLQNPGYTPSCNFSILMSCKSVINSEQGSVFGFPNPLMGLVGFGMLLGLGVAAAAGARLPRWIWIALVGGLGFGIGLVHWFAVQSIFVIEVLCPWCMVVWAVVVPLFWYSLLHVLGKSTDARWLHALRSWHLVPVVLWYLTIAGIILVHFWDYYWKDFFGAL